MVIANLVEFAVAVAPPPSEDAGALGHLDNLSGTGIVRHIMTDTRKRGVSKAQWLEAALDTLEEKGAIGVTIESLARRVGVSKARFYWHFKDREELMSGLLDHWTHELTEVLANNPRFAEMPPRERLLNAAETIVEYDLTRYELAIRQWAAHDDLAAKAVNGSTVSECPLSARPSLILALTPTKLKFEPVCMSAIRAWKSRCFQSSL